MSPCGKWNGKRTDHENVYGKPHSLLANTPETRYIGNMANTPTPPREKLAKLTAEVPQSLADHLKVVLAMNKTKLKDALAEAISDWCAKKGSPPEIEVAGDDKSPS